MKKVSIRELPFRKHAKALNRSDRWFEKLMSGEYLGRIARRRGHSRQYKRSALSYALWRHRNTLPF